MGKVGIVLGGLPLGSVAFTSQSNPGYAELVPTLMVAFCCRVTSFRRRITAEGSTTNTFPLPLFVLIPALRVPAQSVSPGTIVHPVLVQTDLWEQVAPPVIAPLFPFRTQWVLPVFP